jgi:hypothetical protein
MECGVNLAASRSSAHAIEVFQPDYLVQREVYNHLPKATSPNLLLVSMYTLIVPAIVVIVRCSGIARPSLASLILHLTLNLVG